MLDSDNDGRSAARTMSRALGTMLRASDGILDLLPIATFICDAAGVILQYNQRAVEIWGRAPNPGQTHDDFRGALRSFELDGTPVRDAERIIERADGSQVIVSINIDPLRDAKGHL